MIPDLVSLRVGLGHAATCIELVAFEMRRAMRQAQEYKEWIAKLKKVLKEEQDGPQD